MNCRTLFASALLLFAGCDVCQKYYPGQTCVAVTLAGSDGVRSANRLKISIDAPNLASTYISCSNSLQGLPRQFAVVWPDDRPHRLRIDAYLTNTCSLDPTNEDGYLGATNEPVVTLGIGKEEARELTFLQQSIDMAGPDLWGTVPDLRPPPPQDLSMSSQDLTGTIPDLR